MRLQEVVESGGSLEPRVLRAHEVGREQQRAREQARLLLDVEPVLVRLVERDAAVTKLTLNRPEAHNAMSERLMAEVPEAVRRIAATTRSPITKARTSLPLLSAANFCNSTCCWVL